MKMEDATVLVTGGTGTFGTGFVQKCLYEGAENIIIFSRDEKKQYDMINRYQRDRRLHFVIGDVREYESINRAMTGVDYVFHAAAMKQVPSCEAYPSEAVKTNVIGSRNVIQAAIDSGVKKVICLSTDKAVYPTSTMGITKAMMEKIALQFARQQSETKICITRFGNLVSSRGSVVPLFIKQASEGKPLTVTDPAMTRFFMTLDDAIEIVMSAFETGENGDIVTKPVLAATMSELASAVLIYMGLPSDYPMHTIGRRNGEKIHETLLSDEEALRTKWSSVMAVVPLEGKENRYYPEVYKSQFSNRYDREELVEMIRNVDHEISVCSGAS